MKNHIYQPRNCPDGDGNQWLMMTGRRDCIAPCGGHPVVRTKPGKVRTGADDMPAYLKCSECGCTPLPKDQPDAMRRFLQYYLNHRPKQC